MMENKFKVGQWVRCVDGAGTARVKDGESYKIEDIDGIYVKVNGGAGMYASRFEPWQPRVGERVLFTAAVPAYWFFGPSTGYKDGVVTSVNDAGYKFTVDTRGATARVNIEHIEPITATQPDTPPVAEQPAALKIQAGKFYKTRDGRKVGPMEKSEWGGYRDRSRSVTSRCWSEAGTFIEGCTSNLDLIAEWVDEPVSAVETKFKVGDWVKHENGLWLRFYEVVEVNGSNFCIDVFGARKEYSFDSCNWIVRQGDEPTTSIVCPIENGQPLPATRPYIHTSVDAADKEAQRLASVHKGQEFGVFTLGAVHKEARIYEHEWQRLAADGRKIEAIKALRGMSGLGLATSKTAVEDWLHREVRAKAA